MFDPAARVAAFEFGGVREVHGAAFFGVFVFAAEANGVAFFDGDASADVECVSDENFDAGWDADDPALVFTAAVAGVIVVGQDLFDGAFSFDPGIALLFLEEVCDAAVTRGAGGSGVGL